MDDGSLESGSYKFEFPSFAHDEPGEIERVQGHYQIKTEDFVEKFIERARQGKLIKLTDGVWDTVENTDTRSGNILRGDWDTVARLAGEYNRDWRKTRREIQNNEPLDAPIIARQGDKLHLVAGNTRLMCCRALGIRPDVLIVDITDFQ